MEPHPLQLQYSIIAKNVTRSCNGHNIPISIRVLKKDSELLDQQTEIKSSCSLHMTRPLVPTGQGKPCSLWTED